MENSHFIFITVVIAMITVEARARRSFSYFLASGSRILGNGIDGMIYGVLILTVFACLGLLPAVCGSFLL